MVKISGGDGCSLENAIIISECNESEGVEQEYVIVTKKFGKYKLIHQSLLNNNGKFYDLLELDINDDKINMYFNITDFFSKY